VAHKHTACPVCRGLQSQLGKSLLGLLITGKSTADSKSSEMGLAPCIWATSQCSTHESFAAVQIPAHKVHPRLSLHAAVPVGAPPTHL
jgi:hypothetical protein